MTLKTWLSLTLAVLLVHLALLHRLPLSLHLTPAQVTSTFETRTLVLPAEPAMTATKAASTTPIEPKAKAKPKAIPPKTAPAAPVPESSNPGNGASVASLSTTAGLEQDISETTTEPAITAAAEPASAPAPGAEPAQNTDDAAQTAAPQTTSSTHEAVFNASSLPASVKLKYRVESNKFPYMMNSELLWQRQELTYQARLTFSAFGLSRVQTSRGLIDQHGLAPERFSDKSRSEVAAHFNRERGVVTFSANTPELPLLPGAQDRLSVLLQLGALVASAPQGFPPGTTLSVQTIGPRSGEPWLFTFGEMETLDLPGGPQLSLKLVRQPREPYGQQVTVWLAPALGYLPVRTRITESNGDYADQKWESSEAADSP